MKFVRFGGGKTGLVVEADGLKVIDAHATLGRLRDADRGAAETIAGVLPSGTGQDWADMIRSWDSVRGAFQTLVGQAESGRDMGFDLVPLEAAQLEAPLASPTVRIFAIGSNTSSHYVKVIKTIFNRDVPHEDAYKPKRDGLPPPGFTIWPSVVVGPEAVVAPPRGTLKFDYEAECAVYVKQGGRYLETVDLWGYTAFNDFGVRDTHLNLAKESGWGPMALNTPKNFDNGKSAGPWVAVDEPYDLSKLRCVLLVNGEVRQDWNLSEMIHSFNDVLSFLSIGLTLLPGDMVASGTGTGNAFESGVDGPYWLKPGDVIDIKLDGAGTLRNVVGHW